MAEVAVFYHMDDEETPYKVMVTPGSGTRVTLGDLKKVVNRPNYKYFFQSKDPEFGPVKEELVTDSSPLPMSNGRVVCWLELSQGSVIEARSEDSEDSDEVDQEAAAGGRRGGGGGTGGGRHHHRLRGGLREETATNSDGVSLPPPTGERGAGVGETRPPSFHGGVPTYGGGGVGVDSESVLSSDAAAMSKTDDYDDTESSITSVSQAAAARQRQKELRMRMNGAYPGGRSGSSSKQPRLPGPGIRPPGASVGTVDASAASSSMISSELESSVFDSEDVQSMASSRFTTSTDHTSVSQQVKMHINDLELATLVSSQILTLFADVEESCQEAFQAPGQRARPPCAGRLLLLRDGLDHVPQLHHRHSQHGHRQLPRHLHRRSGRDSLWSSTCDCEHDRT